MKTATACFCLTCLALAALWPLCAPAQWSTTPYSALAVIDTPIRRPSIRDAVRLGSGNYLATYGVTISHPEGDLYLAYMQLITPDGYELWGEDGIPVSFPHDSSQAQVFALEDGQGGAFVVWWDDRLSIGYDQFNDLFGQHISSQGELLWEIEGRHLTSLANEMQYIWDIRPDLTGGFFAVWSDDINILAQHFDSEGQALWPRNAYVGKRSVPMYAVGCPNIAPHPDGGCLVMWVDFATPSEWVFVQRLSARGMRLWQPSGVNLNISGGSESDIIPDGQGGIFYRGLGQVARVNQDGQILWIRDINNNGFDTQVGQFAINPFNNLLYVIFSKHNPYGSWNDDIFGTALDYGGHFRFPSRGLPVIVEPTADQMQPRFCFRGNGMIVYCMDERNYSQTYYDIYFQITDSLWQPQLSLQGAPFFIGQDADLISDWAKSIISDNADGAVGFPSRWDDSSFANHILADGTLGYPVARQQTALPPGRIEGIASDGIRFHLNQGGEVQLELYDLMGRKIETLFEGYLPEGDHRNAAPAAGLASGFYIVRLSASGWRTTARAIVVK